jgi:hypothetical protein
MAILIYVYELDGKKDHLHLAAELTNLKPSKEDSYKNYISYYAAYTEFPSAEGEMKSIKGFSVATPAEDKSKHTLKEIITIPTQEDNASLPATSLNSINLLSEESIARQWQEARSLALKNSARHSGTIIHNLITSQPLLQVERQDAKEEKGWRFTSLNRTIQEAKVIEPPKGFVGRHELEKEYRDHRKNKHFWEGDSPDMANVWRTLQQHKKDHKNPIWIPSAGLVCKCIQTPIVASSSTLESKAARLTR